VNWFDIHRIFFTVLDYPMSYLEFAGTIAGAVAVVLAARGNIWSWPVGIINVTLFFVLFFQVQLYPDMFLQIFFFVTNIVGWYRWAHPGTGEEDKKNELRVSLMQPRQWFFFLALSAAGTASFGALASHLHEWFNTIFVKPSAFPYLDSFVTIMSILATFLLIQKKVESWAFWLLADVIATGMYMAKGIRFVGLEYLAFCFNAAFGWWSWRQQYRSYTIPS
jgi:nicotinamide mononucleotide transporter